MLDNEHEIITKGKTLFKNFDNHHINRVETCRGAERNVFVDNYKNLKTY